MKEALKYIGEVLLGATLCPTGLVKHIPRRHAKTTVSILYYHEVGPPDILPGLYVELRFFNRQMDYLRRHENVIHMHHALALLTQNVNGTSNNVVVTFDGGYRGLYDFAYSVLRRNKIPAIAYLVTGAIDGKLSWDRILYYQLLFTNKRSFVPFWRNDPIKVSLVTVQDRKLAYRKMLQEFSRIPSGELSDILAKLEEILKISSDGLTKKLFLSWDMVRELDRSGLVTFGSHTVTHTKLTSLSDDEAWYELTESKKRIEHEVGHPIDSFCYPDGFFSERIMDMARAAGYTSALVLRDLNGLGGLNYPSTNPMALRRIFVNNQPLTSVFVLRASGALDGFANIGRRLKRARS